VKNDHTNSWSTGLFPGIKSNNWCEFFALRSSRTLDGSMSVLKFSLSSAKLRERQR